MLTDAELDEIEARFRRYAEDDGMPQVEWETLGVRLTMDAWRLVAEIRRLRAASPADVEETDG